jgi:hypothetical protein
MIANGHLLNASRVVARIGAEPPIAIIGGVGPRVGETGKRVGRAGPDGVMQMPGLPVTRA